MQTGAGDLLCFLSFSHPTESVLLIALGKPAVSWRLKNSLGWLKKCSSCWKCCVQMNRMAPDSGWPPTVDDTTLQTSLWTSNTLDSPLLPDSGTFSSIPGLDFHKMCLLLKPDHCSTVQLFFSFDQVRCSWCCRWFRSDLMHQWWFLTHWHWHPCEALIFSNWLFL